MNKYKLCFLLLASLFLNGCSDDDDKLKQNGEIAILTPAIYPKPENIFFGKYNRTLYIFEGDECVAVQQVLPEKAFERIKLPAGREYSLVAIAAPNYDSISFSQAPVIGISKKDDKICINDFEKPIPEFYLGQYDPTSLSDIVRLEVIADRTASLLKFQIRPEEEMVANIQNIQVTVSDLCDQISIDGKEYSMKDGVAKSKTIVLEENGKGKFENTKNGTLLFPNNPQHNSLNISVKVNFKNGTQETYSLKPQITLKAGMQTNLYIRYAELQNGENADMTAELAEWNTPFDPDIRSAVSFALPDFTDSYIYELYNGEILLGEICKEQIVVDRTDDPQILNNQKNYQLMIFYPAADGVVTRENGYVLNNGGRVSWTGDIPTYKPGTNALKPLYICEFGQIVENAEETREGQVLPKRLKDKRGFEITEYPIVKIGGQIWMAASLNTTKYIDGTEIKTSDNWAAEKDPLVCAYGFPTDLTSADALKVREEYGLLYNYAASISNEIAPVGWHISKASDWKTMVTYLGYGAVKTTADNNYVWTPALTTPLANLSGLSLRGTGSYNGGRFSNQGYATYYWANIEEEFNFYFFAIDIPDTTPFGIGAWTKGPSVGYPIRCVLN